MMLILYSYYYIIIYYYIILNQIYFSTLLSNEEVIEGLTRLGGINIQIVNLGGRIDNIEDFIICTGTSTRHLRKMSDTIVKALVSRDIKEGKSSIIIYHI